MVRLEVHNGNMPRALTRHHVALLTSNAHGSMHSSAHGQCPQAHMMQRHDLLHDALDAWYTQLAVGIVEVRVEASCKGGAQAFGV